MPFANINPAEELSSPDKDIDLSSLACDAAIELDNLVIGKSVQIDAIERLSDLVLKTLNVQDAGLLNASFLFPATVAVMSKAISDTITLVQPLTTIDRLLEETEKIREQLLSLREAPQDYRAQNMKGIEEMRAFCLALSKRASAYERPLDQWEPSTPFGG